MLPLESMLPPAIRPDNIRFVQEAVAKLYRISLNQMLGNARPARLAWPRQVAVYLCAVLKLGTFTEIGRRFGRDHSTVSKTLVAVQNALECYPVLRFEVARLAHQLRRDINKKAPDG